MQPWPPHDTSMHTSRNVLITMRPIIVITALLAGLASETLAFSSAPKVQHVRLPITTWSSFSTSLSMAAGGSAWRQHPAAAAIPPNCKLTAEEIEGLIKKRNKARRARNFALADKLLSDLKSNNVMLDDKKKLWRADGEFFGDEKGSPAYRKAPNSKPISEKDEAYVCEKLEERAAAKQRKDYDIADDIMDELRFLMNVAVDDKKMTWRVTDPFKTLYTYGGQRFQNIPKESLKKIEQLVRDRADEKKKKNYRRADEILEDLKIHFGVRVDDNKKAWYFIQKSKEERAALNKEKESAKEKADRKGKKKKSKAKLEVSDWSVLETDTAMPEGISVEDTESMPDAISIETPKPVSQEKSELEALTMPRLKEKLREKGLAVSGRKAELIDRLLLDE